ncbi:biofilm PGA synthesis lipoprotein PgaB [Crenobacter luteus]|uniref:poly-beta-1,6-N-acetyl-D-glucosamine N-deacetylase PgaB n=1 Tax=Crenobacter luteus TaxID=1452487 RepID=UPI00104FABE4|nr:poly-beta-1,6-N-acetyl-D-glucosamine N-deacetylase PgaB [Crenobacter luteus]TCP12447.1 biofilm PGA synthesis lipoprotein PgaB [Crenobacter luteus]
MRRILTLILGLLALTTLQAANAQRLHILNYHEIANPADARIPAYAVSPTNFVRQLDWLKNNGYRFVGIDELLADRAGGKPLPDKAVLITFDDGYENFYTQAYPVLKMFGAPAVVSLVGSWLEPSGGQVRYGDEMAPRSAFLSWAQIRQMQAEGLVEFASHSYALHEGVSANPQGNSQPAATTRRYRAGRYETPREQLRRVEADLARNNALLRKMTGRSPRVMVWPYGSYSRDVAEAADRQGMPVGLTLDDGPNDRTTPLWKLRRLLMESSTTLPDLARELALRERDTPVSERPGKIMHVDLDYLYDPDPAQTERNIGLLLDRITAMGVNTVYLQAFSDPDGNGAADAAYFPNRHLPVRADLFNRVAWQIKKRTPVKAVYAWMPMLAFELPKAHPAARDVVVTRPHAATGHVAMGYPRLSPFSPRARRVIREIFDDLGRAAPFEGLLFHDDVTLSDYEDASPAALATYRRWGLPDDIEALRGDDDLLGRWTILKINALDAFARELADVVRISHPALKTARNLYAQVVLNPRAETWYAQSLDNSLANYDYTAIMAMPYMENAEDPARFMQDLFERVAEHPGALDKTVFELQATDWRHGRAVPNAELAETIRTLYRRGARHVGYYPDDPFKGHPDPATLRDAFATMSPTGQLQP